MMSFWFVIADGGFACLYCMWWWPFEWMRSKCDCLCMPTCVIHLRAVLRGPAYVSPKLMSASYYSPAGRDSLVNQHIFFHSSRRLV